MLSTPSVTVRKLDPRECQDYAYLVCSDGVSDVFYWHQMGRLFQQAFSSKEATTEDAATALWEQTLFNGEQVFGEPWDDLCMVLGRVCFMQEAVDDIQS